jgi:hypothetical protein
MFRKLNSGGEYLFLQLHERLPVAVSNYQCGLLIMYLWACPFACVPVSHYS